MSEATVAQRQYRSAAEYDVHTLRAGATVRLLPVRNGQPELGLVDEVDALNGVVVDVAPKGFGVIVRKGTHGPPQQHFVLWGTDHALGGYFTVEVRVEQEFFR